MREVLADVLRDEGFAVLAVSSAEEALEALERATFDVLLTDYRLPQRTGAWLLHEASKRGFLERTPAIIISAEDDPPGIDGYPFVQKPADFEVVLSAIRAAINPPRSVDTPAASDADVDLVLYVMPGSIESQRALKRLHRVLAKFEPGKVNLAVIDAQQDADGLEEDRIVVTPTLVRKQPAPKIWFVGSLSNTAGVEEMIRVTLDREDKTPPPA